MLNHNFFVGFAQILGKCEFLNPGGSVKDRVAVKIIEEVMSYGALLVFLRKFGVKVAYFALYSLYHIQYLYRKCAKCRLSSSYLHFLCNHSRRKNIGLFNVVLKHVPFISD